MYVLLVAIPCIALVRAYGSERPLSALGLDSLAARDTKIESLADFGNQWQGVFGWPLFALIVGHVGMAFVHT